MVYFGVAGEVSNDAIAHLRSNVCGCCCIQTPGFGDGEAFKSDTFTGKASTGWRDHNIELEEMEVFAVSGFP